MLNEKGVVITNIISSLEGKDSKFIKYEYTTYKAIFDDVKIYRVADLENSRKQNLILVGIKGETEVDNSKKDEYSGYLNNQISDLEITGKIVTDDFAPIGN